jgi:hypothetical protein
LTDINEFLDGAIGIAAAHDGKDRKQKQYMVKLVGVPSP